jgi:hypothetical protein
MGEGQMRAESGYIKGAYTYAAMAVMAPLAAVYMKFINLARFPAGDATTPANLFGLLGFFALIVGGSVGAVHLLGRVAAPGQTGYRYQALGFLGSGALAGLVLALSVFGMDFVAALQGGIGGTAAAAWIAFMVPKRLLPEPAVFV